MKKHFTKTEKHGHYHRISLGIHGPGLGHHGSPDYSPYYAYPLVVITVHKVPPAHIQQDAPFIWTPRLLQDKYSPSMPPTVIKIAANYISRFI
ncbi:MAG: hypothetical protein PHD43_09700 [Methylococcales bacterium]|nr:hypothetical protein [Methylococcales bacterium]